MVTFFKKRYCSQLDNEEINVLWAQFCPLFVSRRTKIQTASRGMDSSKNKKSIQKSVRSSGNDTNLGRKLSKKDKAREMGSESSGSDGDKTSRSKSTVQRKRDLGKTNKQRRVDTSSEESGDGMGVEGKRIRREPTIEIKEKEIEQLEEGEVITDYHKRELLNWCKLIDYAYDHYSQYVIATDEGQKILYRSKFKKMLDGKLDAPIEMQLMEEYATDYKLEELFNQSKKEIEEMQKVQ